MATGFKTQVGGGEYNLQFTTDNHEYYRVVQDAARKCVYYAKHGGVGLNRWIPVTERLPKESDADDDNCVLAIHKATKKRYFHWRSVADNPFDFTHWRPLPEVPREDVGDEIATSAAPPRNDSGGTGYDAREEILFERRNVIY
ncbi:MAG: hypothetical protein J6J43_01080 [Oscillospiraceae bacterium]|nr:hypothetical protein [Oscillospiraceae bacterium]